MSATLRKAHAAERRHKENQVAMTWLARLTAEVQQGRPVTPAERVAIFRDFVTSGRLATTEPLLPLLLSLKGKPYDLNKHFLFSPFFRTTVTPKLVLKTARQVSKSTTQAAAGILFANSVPHTTSLFITPLFEQIRRFSANYVGDFINNSPVKAIWSDSTTNNSVLQRTFRDFSKMIFSYALLNADRVRGITGDVCAFDEVQDLDREHIPIIEETMSYSHWELSRYSGTPKSLDNTIQKLWESSSQAEWVIPCGACGHYNIPSLEHDLHAMIGPYRDDITEDNPGVICARPKCRKVIQPRYGRWQHRYPKLMHNFAGYHVPQILMPMHYGTPKKWETILAKRENLSPAVFANEVLGESYDTGSKLVTLTDLRNAAVLPWKNNPDEPDPTMMALLESYSTRVLAIDWGGGGAAGVSYTTLALLGWRSDGVIDVLWGKRLKTPHDHNREAREVLEAIRVFAPHAIAHDYTGAGTLRETVMVQAGVPVERIMPVAYIGAASGRIIRHVPATVVHPRDHYRVDKTRSLLYTTNSLRLGALRTFQYDFKNNDSPGLLHDFLALIDEKVESRSSSGIYIIRRQEGFPDDFAQAVNIGCVACWHINDALPDFGKLCGFATLDRSQLTAAIGVPEIDDADYSGGLGGV